MTLFRTPIAVDRTTQSGYRERTVYGRHTEPFLSPTLVAYAPSCYNFFFLGESITSIRPKPIPGYFGLQDIMLSLTPLVHK